MSLPLPQRALAPAARSLLRTRTPRPRPQRRPLALSPPRTLLPSLSPAPRRLPQQQWQCSRALSGASCARASFSPMSGAGPVGCWKCSKPTEQGAFFCDDCGSLQAPAEQQTPFDTLGLYVELGRRASRRARCCWREGGKRAARRATGAAVALLTCAVRAIPFFCFDHLACPASLAMAPPLRLASHQSPACKGAVPFLSGGRERQPARRVVTPLRCPTVVTLCRLSSFRRRCAAHPALALAQKSWKRSSRSSCGRCIRTAFTPSRR